ncbi:sulfate adenylyltransferase, partial [Candidatus Bathyarchaeota archaeon]|nr:sulfate adenylyltransferase [Candidatus Bathyarchaeota archaeon]
MPRPHGGRLVDRFTPPLEKAEAAEEASKLPKIEVSHELRLDLENIASGLYSPLTGPMTQNDYRTVLAKGRLSDDLPWTIPIL